MARNNNFRVRWGNLVDYYFLPNRPVSPSPCPVVDQFAFLIHTVALARCPNRNSTPGTVLTVSLKEPLKQALQTVKTVRTQERALTPG
jgi:hypothetical protein